MLEKIRGYSTDTLSHLEERNYLKPTYKVKNDEVPIMFHKLSVRASRAKWQSETFLPSDRAVQ